VCADAADFLPVTLPKGGLGGFGLGDGDLLEMDKTLGNAEVKDDMISSGVA
jgi:hypothetical protein